MFPCFTVFLCVILLKFLLITQIILFAIHVPNDQFAEFDNPLKCDNCSSLVHNKCSGLSATEFKYFGLKNRFLKFFCVNCDQGLKELPELKTLIYKLFIDFYNINSINNTHFTDEFVSNEIDVQIILYFIMLKKANQIGLMRE